MSDVLLCVLFFFFKQKTAYEMRISDWSSDVCSSDLTINRQKASSRPHCASRWRQCLRSPDQKDARVMRAPTRGSKTDFVPRRPLSSEPRQLRVASACLIRKLRALDWARSDLPCGAGANSPEPGSRSARPRVHT